MKRFHSNLQKIRALCKQQSRLAQLDFARKNAQWEASKRDEATASVRLDSAQDAVVAALRLNSPGIIVRNARNSVSVMEDELKLAQRRTAEVYKTLLESRRIYEEHRSKEEGISRIIERQRAEHRKLTLRQQQGVLDEVASARWTRVPESRSEVGHG